MSANRLDLEAPVQSELEASETAKRNGAPASRLRPPNLDAVENKMTELRRGHISKQGSRCCALQPTLGSAAHNFRRWASVIPVGPATDQATCIFSSTRPLEFRVLPTLETCPSVPDVTELVSDLNSSLDRVIYLMSLVWSRGLYWAGSSPPNKPFHISTALMRRTPDNLNVLGANFELENIHVFIIGVNGSWQG